MIRAWIVLPDGTAQETSPDAAAEAAATDTGCVWIDFADEPENCADSVLDRLAFIKKAQVLGFTLDEIRELIAHKRRGENPCGEVRSIVKGRLKDLDERIAQMTQYRDEHAAALKEWEKTKERAGHVCGLIETSHIEHPVEPRRVGKK